ncbi:hypothetical protein ACH5RR_026185 [Cinchona calisaya]|uniref:Uncharacterized protein n=1 Tax=Cinchona calisaya TaxID=153742 RepID=A0ABD2Z6U6_9GENT
MLEVANTISLVDDCGGRGRYALLMWAKKEIGLSWNGRLATSEVAGIWEMGDGEREGADMEDKGVKACGESREGGGNWETGVRVFGRCVEKEEGRRGRGGFGKWTVRRWEWWRGEICTNGK